MFIYNKNRKRESAYNRLETTAGSIYALMISLKRILKLLALCRIELHPLRHPRLRHNNALLMF